MSGLRPRESLVRVTAPAKVNLALSVGPRRADGYHEIDTLLQAIDLADELEARRTSGGEGIGLAVEGEDTGLDGDNLVVLAARAFLDAAGLGRDAPGLSFHLTKRIPVGAGLGGGSSDAAAALRALDRLFPAALSRARLSQLAARLGSDVPFFLCASPLARARGRGERLEALPTLPPRSGVVVMPPAGMPTALAYSRLERQRSQAGEGATPAPDGAEGPLEGTAPGAGPVDWEEVAAGAMNDFQETVVREVPLVRECLDALGRTGPELALLSGSGAASFAIYRSEEEAAEAGKRLAAALDARVFRVRTLSAWHGRATLEP